MRAVGETCGALVLNLRRFIHHVRGQEWTAITIDLMVVVVGVVLGIQVSNWNAERLDRQLAQRYLADIASDIRSDLSELARVEASAMDRIAASAYILQQAGIVNVTGEVRISDARVDDVFAKSLSFPIPVPPQPSADARSNLWEAAFRTYAYDLNRGAYDALLGAGKLDLITDPMLMRVLQEYYYLVNSLDRTQERTMFPTRTIIQQIGLSQGLSPGLVVDEETLIARIKSTPALAACVASGRQSAAATILIAKVQKEKGEELLQLLASNGIR